MWGKDWKKQSKLCGAARLSLEKALVNRNEMDAENLVLLKDVDDAEPDSSAEGILSLSVTAREIVKNETS